MTDQQALARYTDHRDAHAFRQLVETYSGLVYSAARRRLARSHDIDDVVQLTFLKLANSSSTIKEDLGSWLYTTTLNNATDLIRADQSRRRHEAHAPSPAPSADPHAHILSQEEWQILSPKIDDAILELPPIERSLVIQHFFQKRSQRDLAKQLNTTQPTIHRRLNAAIESLRQSLRASGHLSATPALIGTLHVISKTTIPAALSAQLTKIGLVGTGARVSCAATHGVSIAKSFTGTVVGKVAAVVLITFAAAIAGFCVYLRTASPTVPPGAAVPGVAAVPRPDVAPTFIKLADFSEPGAQTEAGPMLLDSAGNIYALGRVTHYDTNAGAGPNPPIISANGVIRVKHLGSQNWEIIEDRPGFMFDHLAADAKGNVYVSAAVGKGPGISRPTYAAVFKRPVGQSALIELERYDINGVGGNNAISVFSDFAADDAGNLYIVGANDYRETKAEWIVRKIPNGQSQSQIVDRFSFPHDPETQSLPCITHPVSICISTHPRSAGIYVTGFAGPLGGSRPPGVIRSYVGTTYGTHWLVRKSTDGGATWATIDDFRFDANPQTQLPLFDADGNSIPISHMMQPFLICSNRAGILVTAGIAMGQPAGIIVGPPPVTASFMHWMVRESADAGATWSVDFDLPVPTGGFNNSLPYVFFSEPNGAVYMTGKTFGLGRSGADLGVTYSNADGRWSLTDSVVNCYTQGIVADKDGNLYANSTQDDGTFPVRHQWIIRSRPTAAVKTP